MVYRQVAFSYWAWLIPNQLVLPRAFLCDVQKLMRGRAVWSIMVNYLTRQGRVLPRCYFLGRQALCRLWGCGPASRSSMVPQLAQRQECGSLRPDCHPARSAGCAVLPTCVVQLSGRGCNRICLMINMGREERVGAELDNIRNHDCLSKIY